VRKVPEVAPGPPQRLRARHRGATAKQRRSVLTALARTIAAPRTYAPPSRGPGNFIDSLFRHTRRCPPSPARRRRRPAPSAPSASAPATAVIPVSSPPTRRFQDDERTCKRFARPRKRRCSPTAIRRDINQAVSINGQAYTSLPNAFQIPHESTRPAPAGRRPDLVGSAEVGRRPAGVEQATSSSPRRARDECSSRAAKGATHRPLPRKAGACRTAAARLQQPPRPIRRLPPRQGQGPHRRPDLHPRSNKRA